ncbi:hypothetical protein GCM10020220_020610 [Nonomuraea rubra]|uniref:hypothetical protein n=1 Tax=Nonomuraea rubra TaxID=46180 RepID=UPI0031EE9E63
MIALAGTELLASIVNAVTAWLNRHQHRSVKLEIDGDVLELTASRRRSSASSPTCGSGRRGRPDASPRPGDASR